MSIEILERHVEFWCLKTADEVFCELQKLGFVLTDYGLSGTGKYAMKDRYLYRQGKADYPMLVCHADTVRPVTEYDYDPLRHKVTCLGLDDRLGIASITYAIEMGLAMADCSILITDNEESGQSTAETFSDDWKYSKEDSIAPTFLIELDRRGTDAVTYQYDNAGWHSVLRHVGFEIGTGSFSDISSMQSMGISGVNIGIGYHREHSKECYASLVDTMSQILKTDKLVMEFGHVRFEHEIVDRGYGKYGGHYSKYTADFDDYYGTKSYKPVTHTLPVPVIMDNPMDSDDGEDWEIVDGDEDTKVQCDDCLEFTPLSDCQLWGGIYNLCPDCYQTIDQHSSSNGKGMT